MVTKSISFVYISSEKRKGDGRDPPSRWGKRFLVGFEEGLGDEEIATIFYGIGNIEEIYVSGPGISRYSLLYICNM